MLYFLGLFVSPDEKISIGPRSHAIGAQVSVFRHGNTTDCLLMHVDRMIDTSVSEHDF